MPTLVVEVWSDVVCPFCAIGHRQLAAALEGFEHRSATEVVPRAFELDPRERPPTDRSLNEIVARKYGLSVDQAATFHAGLEAEAATWGLTWRLDDARPANTFDAHRLVALATTQRLGNALLEALFDGYFAHGLCPDDREALASVAAAVGVADPERAWRESAFGVAVREDEARAVELGVSGVPAALIDGRFWVHGAQGTDVIAATLQRAWDRRVATG